MADGDFELTFQRLGLTPSEANASCETTLTSAPRVAASSLIFDSSLPRLQLATPTAALESGGAEGELVAVQVLGEGGMGVVLLARQHSLGREVAVKILKPGVVDDAAAAQALIEEARTTGSLEHPGVVPVYALARDAKGLPALVMKRVEGVSWRELLNDPEHVAWESVARGRDRLEANLEILIQVCNAIAHAHKRGVIHRDLKPANVLIGELGEVYVADWGVAIQKANVRPGSPRLVGTPAYLAPEMVTGDPLLTDERTDIYLLGGTLHQILTGRPTHRGTTVHDVLQRAFEGAAPTFGADIPIELAQLCTTALTADPNARFQTVLELRDALRLFIASRDSTRLVEAALQRLKQLEALASAPPDEENDRRFYSLLSECRFGFRQALEAHSLAEGARHGLRKSLKMAVQRELDRGHTAAARTFLAELTPPPGLLVEGLRALEAKDALRLAENAKFQQLTHEHDPSVHGKQRSVVLAAFAGAIGVIAILVSVIGQRTGGAMMFGPYTPVVPLIVIAAFNCVLVFIFRRSLLSTRLNRQLTFVGGVCLGFLMITRALSVWMGVALNVTLTFEGLMLAAMMTVCALVWHWGLFLPAAIFFVGGVGSAVFPSSAINLFTLSTGLAVLSGVAMLRRWRKDVADERVLR